ncbi:Tat pathway signal sequence domain protein [Actinomyces urogenitalis DSM 15434]|uniref:Tat pathway signal sequence domain protein n=2 Tax=Actinomyces urogenitalis TaxID=103621 RepID=C0W326_9ACTO|nr:YibE/F family protein [Actinomyces urogenitalis]EEH66838.1 Tat pathway signal sequence domain protein [Actinomyces urogenitalis DSM 15434]MDK8237658.1 YibE/F family protein [Actinomyces urogenitalis]MDK8835923.1 YibE/F family protein [Actinomyces urogenitalis]MDU0863499.1 YibE/F family protein [Actinomyces urogenitalis]MDU0873726.1 YibE/F family protein [Actinomyces urogenitalis]
MSTEPRTPGLRRAAGHAHDHGGPLRLAPGESRRVRIVLAALVVPLVLATLLGIAVLWPGRVEAIGSQPFAAEGASLATARVTATQVSSCAESAASLGGISDGSLLGDAVCAEITSGEGRGLVVPVHVPAESLPAAQVGDRMRVMYTAQALAGGTPYVFVDYDRQLPVGALAVAYLVLVVAVAGLKGLRAVLGLVLATGVLLRFMIPALLALHPPLLVTLVGSVAMMLLAVYVAHGVSVRTTTALLGTLAGVVITVVLALWGVDAANLTGAVGEDALTLTAIVPGLSLTSLLTCGMVIAGLGVLNDVTITQASAVWELHAANPTLSRARLLTGGMRIGRDHIASTVYTLAFAYAGTALPLILAAALIDRSVVDTLLSGEIAEEIVRTLVSSIGLVLAIPATTAIAAALCAPARHEAAVVGSQAGSASGDV